MPVELTIRVISPLAPEDKDLLTGVAILTLAIANHEMAKTRFPETFGDEAEKPEQGVGIGNPDSIMRRRDGTRG